MNYQDIERRQSRPIPNEDDAPTELTRLWFAYLREQEVDVEHLSADADDPNLRYWRAIDAGGDE